MAEVYDALAAGVPQNILEALDTWADVGRLPGGFTTAVLENDFMEAVSRADAFSFAMLKEIALYVYNVLPRPCWGSVEKVAAWEAAGGWRGQHGDRPWTRWQTG